MEYIIPSQIEKTISFNRLTSKNVDRYEIYSRTPDSTYTSGLRVSLIDTIDNPEIPAPVLATTKLNYNILYTWYLPKNIYLTNDYKVRIMVNGIELSSLRYMINKITKMLTIDHTAITIQPSDEIVLEYYSDIIKRSYMFMEESEIFVKTIFKDTYQYGKHNVIR